MCDQGVSIFYKYNVVYPVWAWGYEGSGFLYGVVDLFVGDVGEVACQFQVGGIG